MWECIGGSVVKGEDSLNGALRETQEEIGLILAPEDGKMVHSVVGRIVDGVKFADILDVWLFEYDGPVSDVYKRQPSWLTFLLTEFAKTTTTKEIIELNKPTAVE